MYTAKTPTRRTREVLWDRQARPLDLAFELLQAVHSNTAGVLLRARSPANHIGVGRSVGESREVVDQRVE